MFLLSESMAIWLPDTKLDSVVDGRDESGANKAASDPESGISSATEVISCKYVRINSQTAGNEGTSTIYME